MTSNSWGLRGWFLFRMASGMAIFPMSWREAALEMPRISRSVRPYSGQLLATSSRRIWVRRRSRSTWRPDSALRNSMMEERASTTAWLEWRRVWACSSTSSSRWCSWRQSSAALRVRWRTKAGRKGGASTSLAPRLRARSAAWRLPSGSRKRRGICPSLSAWGRGSSPGRLRDSAAAARQSRFCSSRSLAWWRSSASSRL